MYSNKVLCIIQRHIYVFGTLGKYNIKFGAPSMFFIIKIK